MKIANKLNLKSILKSGYEETFAIIEAEVPLLHLTENVEHTGM